MKKFRILALVLAVMVLVTACGSKKSAEGQREPDTVRVALHVEPTSLHAGFASSTVATQMGMQLFDTLLVKEGDRFLPSLATEWSWNEDSTRLTFTLRDDIKFHNGEPLTAEDVAFTYNTVADSGFSNALCDFYDHMEVVDDTHVVLVLERPYGAALESVVDPVLGIFPKAYYEEDPTGFVRNPCGTGPYKFVSWESGASITYEANEEYWGKTAEIKNLKFIIYDNADTSAALALQNGEIDVMTSIADGDLKRLQDNAKVQVKSTAGSSVAFIVFSMEDGSIFRDENLRLAIAHAINKEDVLIGAAEGHGVVANSIFPAYTFGISEYEAPGYDPELAKEYLAKAGYPDGLDIEISVCSTDSYYKPAEIVQAQLSEVGINLKMNKMENNAWSDDVFRAGGYGMNPLTFSAPVADVLYYYSMFTTEGGENFGQVSNEELDEAYERAYSESDLEKRAQACYDVVAAYGDHAICIPLFNMDKNIAADAQLQGFVEDPIGLFHANEWSWPAE